MYGDMGMKIVLCGDENDGDVETMSSEGGQPVLGDAICRSGVCGIKEEENDGSAVEGGGGGFGGGVDENVVVEYEIGEG